MGKDKYLLAACSLILGLSVLPGLANAQCPGPDCSTKKPDMAIQPQAEKAKPAADRDQIKKQDLPSGAAIKGSPAKDIDKKNR